MDHPTVMYWPKKFSSNRDYVPVQNDDMEKESTLSSEEGVGPLRQTRVTRLQNCLPWGVAVFFAILSLVQWTQHPKSRFGTYQTNFETDLAFSSSIPLERIRFRGSPHFSNNGTPWIASPDRTVSWPENVQYVGEPNVEVDQNWQRLIGERYFSVSEEEAKRAWGHRRHDYVDQNAGGYTAGFDMFHTLHCLNEIRKSLRPDYYFQGHPPPRAAFHNDHCVEILRQMIQCYGSTTLIPTTYIDGIEHNYIDSDQEHVCRSFTFIRDYTSSRMKGGSRYVPRDQSLLDARKHAIAKAWGSKFGNNEKSGGHVHDHRQHP